MVHIYSATCPECNAPSLRHLIHPDFHDIIEGIAELQENSNVLIQTVDELLERVHETLRRRNRVIIRVGRRVIRIRINRRRHFVRQSV